ncbi:hypothetical protein BH23PLA1_BH23PLA1_32680 [soil metagenome]
MRDQELNRRDFSKFTAAAFGGILAGVGVGAARRDDNEIKPELLLEDPHVCRGLNTCEGKDRTGENACAGMGNCATVESHSCRGENACKGQGGCGDKPGMNTCEGKGDCAVPLNDKAWKKARTKFEERMKEKGQKVGPAPPKPQS